MDTIIFWVWWRLSLKTPHCSVPCPIQPLHFRSSVCIYVHCAMNKSRGRKLCSEYSHPVLNHLPVVVVPHSLYRPMFYAGNNSCPDLDRVVVSFLPLILCAEPSSARNVSTSMLQRRPFQFSELCKSCMRQWSSSNFAFSYKFQRKYNISTRNACRGTIQLGTVKQLTLLLHPKATILSAQGLSARTASDFYRKSNCGTNNCFVYIFKSDTSASWNLV